MGSCSEIDNMRSVCYVSVLLLWAVFSVCDAQADMRVVKLCGREFIRAVVYTCGGSRWRRFSRTLYDDGLRNGAGGSAEDSLSEGQELSRRDLNNLCCQLGCRKSDLTLLCRVDQPL
ncbi:hypothetical protein DNTS_001596 [Danionella cerebrum]|uniref:Insulin-like domain-containing protein n=1 Tax=Danionella cerebrum TaxID=2873325 RepID=A0A553MN51_9TELE|nr:hypothetical protein DNTS_001596 [Danionella translucida]